MQLGTKLVEVMLGVFMKLQKYLQYFSIYCNADLFDFRAKGSYISRESLQYIIIQ